MRVLRDGSTTVGAAFAPGHLTGVFAPRLGAKDPRARGSVGAGLVLELGVRAVARWTPGAPDRVVVRSTPTTSAPISLEAARRTKSELRGRLSVTLTHQLPIGQGFGMSAAGALATARASALALGTSPRKALEIAHLADLFGGGGLGGVAAIAGGGLEVRRRPGIPPWGEIRRSRFPYRVFLATVGPPIPSPGLLRNAHFLTRVEAAAAEGLRELGTRPTPTSFLAASQLFSDRLGLGPVGLRRRLDRIRRTGASAGQAMFGRAIFAVAHDSAERSRLVRTLAAERLSAVEMAVLPPTSETL
ncbi:MAG: hypothetical protein L3K01_04150 [Thermoplasmata archaeon]|nr:hypothetical protein [Thermoplasmata archaeon]